MSRETTTLNAILKLVSRTHFHKLVDSHKSDRYVKGFDTWSQFVSLIYAQLSGARSLREVEVGFNSHTESHYHLGVSGVKRSTLSDANNKRPCELYESLLATLMTQASRKLKKQCSEMLEVIDSTQVRLNRSLYDWAAKGHRLYGIKAHVVYGLEHGTPTHVHVSNANINDCTLFDNFSFKSGVTYLFDKAYCDYEGWKKVIDSAAHFITRAKKNLAYHVIQQRSPVGENILSDQLIELTSANSKVLKDRQFRLVCAKDSDGRVFRVISDRLNDTAENLVALYKKRWKIELFFKWIKQNLKIKSFLGRTDNAVRTQISIAFIVYLLIKMLHEAVEPKTTIRYFCSKLISRLMKPLRTKAPPNRVRKRPKPLWQMDLAL